MKILFIVNMDESVKGGLFLATHNRIKELSKKEGYSFKVFNIVKYDNWFLTLLKKILNRKILRQSNDSFVYDQIKYENLYIKETLFTKISLKFGYDFHLKKVFKEKKCDAKYDIVSAHWGGYPQGCLAYLFKYLNRTPYALTFHGSDIHTFPIKSKGNKKLVLRNIDSADAVFFVSDQLRLQVRELGVEPNTKKYHVSHNSFNPTTFHRLSIVEINNIKEEKKISKYAVGFVGNLIKVKRANMLIEIFTEIQKRIDDNITFFVIGDGELKREIENQANLTNLDVRLTGRVTQSSLNNYYNIMDCLILPSRNEGLGNVILEAQACRTPVVATNTGGIPEVIERQELLVQNKDRNISSEIADKVSKLLLIKSKNNKINSHNITWKEVVKKEVEVFHTLTNTNNK